MTLVSGTKDKPVMAPLREGDNKTIASSGPQRFRPQPTQAKTVTFNPQPPVAHEQRYAPVSQKQISLSTVPGTAPAYGMVPQQGSLTRGARNPILNPHQASSAGISKVPMHPGQPRLSPVAGGIRVLPAHGRLPQVKLVSYSGSSNGEDNEEATEPDSDLSQELAREGYIVYGRSADQGRVRTSNV